MVLPSRSANGLARPYTSTARMLNELSQRPVPESLVDAIFEESNGNPFFVEEVYRHLIEEGRIVDSNGRFRTEFKIDELDVPDNVRLIVGRRLKRFSDLEMRALSAAAVIGRSFSFQLLTAISQTDIDELFTVVEKAQRMGIIVPSSEGPEKPFTFTHELVRQTLLTGMSQPRRQRLHASIAQALETEYGARIEEHAAEIAHHLLNSGPFADREKVAFYLSLAGKGSLRAGAPADARRSLAAAIAYQQQPANQARALVDLACAERGLGDLSAAIAHLQDAVGLYVSLADHESIGRIVFEMAESLVWASHFGEAESIAQRGLSHLGSTETSYRAHLLGFLGYIRSVRGEFSSAMEAFDQALGSPAVTPFLIGRILAYRSLHHFHLLKVDKALEDSRRSAALSNAQDSPWTYAAALAVVMCSLYYLGKPDQALKIATELEPLAKRFAQLAASSSCIIIRAWAEFGQEPNLTSSTAE